MIRPFPATLRDIHPSPSIQKNPQGSNVFPVFVSRRTTLQVQLARPLSCLSFELYPLNLQLWGAAGMRDTFSRKFARRILKPRGKQDQYRLADGGRRQRTISSACPFGWLPARILPSFLPFLPPLLPKGWRGWFEDILGNGKEDEGMVYLA